MTQAHDAHLIFLTLATGLCLSTACSTTAPPLKPQLGSMSADSTAEAPDAPALPPIECLRAGPVGPILLPPEHFNRRYGHGQTLVSTLKSSRAQPIEVCMIAGQLDFLVALRCADGSSPFSSRREAHESRLGHVGPGGRCESIVDHYQVTCPEGEYSVYIDMYMCPDTRPGRQGI